MSIGQTIEKLGIQRPGISDSAKTSNSVMLSSESLQDVRVAQRLRFLDPLRVMPIFPIHPGFFDVQISANGSTFCPPRFATVLTNLLTLLTALLTDRQCAPRKGSQNPVRIPNR
jgi:hypothetical protein